MGVRRTNQVNTSAGEDHAPPCQARGGSRYDVAVPVAARVLAQRQGVDVPTNEERTARLATMRERALLGGGQVRIDQQHARGKLTASSDVVVR